MSRQRVAAFTQALPLSVRESLRDYATAVFEAGPAIFDAAHVEFSSAALDDLVLVASMRRLWQMVDGQARMLDGSLAKLTEHGASAYRVGATVFSYTSPAYGDVHRLRDALFQW